MAATGATDEARRAGSTAASAVTTTPTTRVATIGARVDRQAAQGETEQRADQGLQGGGEPDADAEPGEGADDADQQRLPEHRQGHLVARRADSTQQRELPGPLGHEHGEGVEDDEGADEQRHAGEDQQERGDEAERLRQLVLGLVRLRLTGDGLGALGHQRRDRVDDLLLGEPVGAGHRQGLHLSGRGELLQRQVRLEEDDRSPGGRRVVGRLADDRHVERGAVDDDDGLVADREP
jgi:hypothetical protein